MAASFCCDRLFYRELFIFYIGIALIALIAFKNLILIGGFNNDINHSYMKTFYESYILSSLIKEQTCYKNPRNHWLIHWLDHSCIDLILTNSPYSFQNSCVIETGLSDFHIMTVIVIKTTYEKLKPRIVNYRYYKNFCNDTF